MLKHKACRFKNANDVFVGIYRDVTSWGELFVGTWRETHPAEGPRWRQRSYTPWKHIYISLFSLLRCQGTASHRESSPGGFCKYVFIQTFTDPTSVCRTSSLSACSVVRGPLVWAESCVCGVAVVLTVSSCCKTSAHLLLRLQQVPQAADAISSDARS